MKIKQLGLVDYRESFQAMQNFTQQRDGETEDELWLLEHNPVFTQGLNGKPEHILNLSDIPIVQTDRGGQVTYHGPGQLVAYVLFDLKRNKIGVREMVTRLEQAIITLLARSGIEGEARKDAPGVYVQNKKIASLGLRVKHGACYHGISFNLDMDLSPFKLINPCGYADMEVIDLKGLGVKMSMQEAQQQFVSALSMQMQ
jgi:lipoyl(octanoyl) transferase